MKVKRLLMLSLLLGTVVISGACSPKQEEEKPEEPKPEPYEELLIDRTAEDLEELEEESEMFEFKSANGAYKSLAFGSVEEVVQSLYDVYGYEQFKLEKHVLYSEEVHDTIFVYLNRTKTFAVGVYNNDQVTFIMVKGDSELCEKLKTFAKDLDNNTGFQYKDVENGCVLER